MEKRMRIAFIGIGGVGGYYGGTLARYFLSEDSVESIFVARGKHLERIRKKGLKLITTDGEFIATPTLAADNVENSGPIDLAVFCVKGYDLEQSAELCANNLARNSVVIPLLNGVNNAEKLETFLPECHILNGCVYISANIVEPGVVRQAGGSCQLFFGPDDGNIEDYVKIEKLFKEAGIKAELKTNIKEIVWEKYLFVCPLASVTSVLQQPFGAIMENKDNRELLEGLMREIEIIARAKEIPLSQDIVQVSLGKVSGFPYETKSSMQLDFEKGKKTEIEIFTGYVVKTGKELGINTPLHESIYSRLSSKKRGAFRGGTGKALAENK
jgi:2-dehydropantoate 2-reductase